MKKAFISLLLIISFFTFACKKKINPALNTPLLSAVQSGNIAQVKKLVSDGADVNANIGGLLPIVEAINKKFTDIAKFLVDEEVNVNLQDKDGDTALVVAALRGNMEILPLLKKQGADFNIRNKQGKTALMYGVFSGSLPVVEYLLNNGADVLQQDNTGEDAVSMAIRKKDENSLSLLLKNGSAITLKHIKLAFELLCVANRPGLYPFYISHYPALTKLLEKQYAISKDIDYSQTSRLLKTIFSEDGKRKAEYYENGIIKIFNKNNSFVKAFGNIQFVKEIRYVLQNKIYIKKENNFSIENYPFYVKYIVQNNAPGTCAGSALYGVGINVYFFLYIAEAKYQYLTDSGRSEDSAFISNTGKYYLVKQSSHVCGIINFSVYNYLDNKKIIKIPDDVRLKIFQPYNVIYPNSMAYALEFSKNDEYLFYLGSQGIENSIFIYSLKLKKIIKDVKVIGFEFPFYKKINDYKLFNDHFLIKFDDGQLLKVPFNIKISNTK